MPPSEYIKSESTNAKISTYENQFHNQKPLKKPTSSNKFTYSHAPSLPSKLRITYNYTKQETNTPIPPKRIENLLLKNTLRKNHIQSTSLRSANTSKIDFNNTPKTQNSSESNIYHNSSPSSQTHPTAQEEQPHHSDSEDFPSLPREKENVGGLLLFQGIPDLEATYIQASRDELEIMGKDIIKNSKNSDSVNFTRPSFPLPPQTENSIHRLNVQPAYQYASNNYNNQYQKTASIENNMSMLQMHPTAQEEQPHHSDSEDFPSLPREKENVGGLLLFQGIPDLEATYIQASRDELEIMGKDIIKNSKNSDSVNFTRPSFPLPPQTENSIHRLNVQPAYQYAPNNYNDQYQKTASIENHTTMLNTQTSYPYGYATINYNGRQYQHAVQIENPFTKGIAPPIQTKSPSKTARMVKWFSNLFS